MRAIMISLLLSPHYAEAEPRLENQTYHLPAPKAKKPPCTPYDLHGAVRSGQLKCLERALAHMDINDRDAEGDTPLHNAIEARDIHAIRFLLKRGADIYMRDHHHGYTAREFASHLGYRRLADSFLALERETERFLVAVDENDISAAASSLRRGASLGSRDLRLDTPLHKAAQSGLAEMAKLLLHHGANLEARNYLGETPLHVAALRNHRELMKALLRAGANVNALDERRRTPLDLALNQDDPEMIALLQKKKAKNGVSASVEFDWTESAPPVPPPPVSN